jgi:methylase of polypeptide subunit release factors
MNVNLNAIQSLFMPWNGNNSFIGVAENLAKNLGWYPSDIIENKKNNSIVTGHLFVEHGLENPAVISFIDNRYANRLLDTKEQTNILGTSYNNLIDYHIIIDNVIIRAYHNRVTSDKNIIYNQRLDNFEESLSSDYFCRAIDKQSIRATYPTLEDEMINTISKWKKFIYSELGGKISNEEISNFFNAIIFTRALEDSQTNADFDQVLLKSLWSEHNKFSEILSLSFEKLNMQSYPDQVINKDLFGNIDNLDRPLLNNVFLDFYKSSRTPYKYDFSIISKHALSRIYEKYVSVLSIQENQPDLFGHIPIPIEEINKSSGSYYTPQFIARFFGRYVEKIKPAFLKNDFKMLEPAVGSGTFLRTILENLTDSNHIEKAFFNVTGIDKNKTACDASKLSLTLLYLVSTGKLPQKNINIITEDSMDYFSKNRNFTYDVVISNPPFINYASMSSEDRNKVKSFLSEYAFNKYDLYLSFVKIAIDCLNEEGLGLFVLPSTFLVTDSAKLIRKYLIEKCNVLCIIDLSSVNYKIFEDAGIYPVLLIFQRKRKKEKYTVQATIATIRDDVGRALTDILENKTAANVSYNIFTISQDFFQNEKWRLLTPAESNLKIKLSKYKKIDDFFDIRTGFASGSTNTFIISKNKIPKNENNTYIPYLSDREMDKFFIPDDTQEYLFYPYLEDGTKLDEKNLREKFPVTYKHLYQSHYELSQRNEVLKGKIEWWMPNRPRKPEFMLVPKIVTPHLVFTPKFSLDIEGKYAISRSPFLVLKENSELASIKNDLMFFVLGILNSSVCTWYLLNHSSHYQNGFMMIEPSGLKEIPIIDPVSLSKATFIKFITLVKERFLCESNSKFDKIIALEKEIDRMCMDFYSLDEEEKNVILGNYGNIN